MLLTSPIGFLVEKILLFFESFFSLNKELKDSYTFLLNFNKSYESFIYNETNKVFEFDYKNLVFFFKDLNLAYEHFSSYVSYFFRLVKFYVYEVIFELFFNFFNIFFKSRNIFYFFKILKKSFVF